MNIAIFEPDSDACHALSSMLRTYCSTRTVIPSIFCFSSPEALLQSSHLFSLVFLTYHTEPENSQVQIARLLQTRQPDHPPEVIFLLSSPHDAGLCLEAPAAGYLLKPVLYSQLEELLNQCMTRLRPCPQFIEICSSRIPVKLPIFSIQYAEVRKNLTFLHLENQIYQTYLPLDALARRLPPEDFLRCHRSYLVHLRHVKSIEGSNFMLENGTLVPLRIREKTALRRIYQEYCFRQAKKAFWQTEASAKRLSPVHFREGAPTSRPKSQV
jgi:DNA-binding LytR/AlgR family response regulator